MWVDRAKRREAKESETEVRIEARFAEGADSLGESVETEDDIIQGPIAKEKS